jgi:hypothetical protein
MGLMETPGGRSRMMRDAQTRAGGNYQGGRLRDAVVPERFRANAGLGSCAGLPANSHPNKGPAANSDISTSPEPTRQGPTPLAIQPFMPKIMKMFHDHQVIIVQAPTGTGKSIGISEAIVDEGYQLIVTNPRRIGAVLLAEHLAERDGSPLGEKFGYRHGRRKEADVDCQGVLTTEGYHLKVMLNRLNKEYAPQLDRSKQYAVIWDEAHERTAKGSIMLCLWKEMMLDGYNIKLVISSATIDPKPIVDYFAKDRINVPVIEITAKHHEIIELQHGGKGTIVDDIISADRTLTFVHGKGPIATLQNQVALADPGITQVPLHAELLHKEQQEAVELINSGVGRIGVISTNYAQTSVTLAVDRVISSGLVRRERVGADFERHLTIEESSKAEEMQKRGRVGRLRPGEWSYRGPVPFQDLPAEIPHEIENCQLESLVLQTISSGRDFSELNSKLLYRAPQEHIDHALASLYRLDLIGPKGHITSIGKIVSELPVEVRTGKALALAIKKSKELGLSPDELIIPTIDMVSCIEAKGIVTWESISAPHGGDYSSHHARYGQWRQLLDGDHKSDPVAQMKLFERLLLLRPEQFSDLGIHVNHFYAAVNIRELICERLNLDPVKRAAPDLSEQRIRQLKEVLWAGSIDRLYRFVGQDPENPRNRLYKPVVGHGHLRTLSKDSVVSGNSFVVAEPITIDREYLDPHPARLLVMASAVDTRWLNVNTPPQLRLDVLAAMDKSWDQKPKQGDKQRFYRPNINGRRR